MSRRPRGTAELAGSRSVQHRTGNAIFYVVTEGECPEVGYFDWLNKIYGASCKFQIRMLPPRVRQNGLMPSRVLEHACRLADEPDIRQIWGLFDHDGRNDIDQVCLRAKPDRVHLALSLPIDKLRNAHPVFADYGRRKKRIDKPHFDALMEGDGIRNAVHRARRLSRHFGHETPSQRDPSTEVYRLIEALGVVPPTS